MKFNNRTTATPVKFSIVLILAAAGLFVSTLLVPVAAMATDADTTAPQALLPDEQESRASEDVVIETRQEANVPGVEERAPEADEKSATMDIEEEKQQFLSRHIYFAFNSSELDEQARALIKEQAAWMADNPDVRVQVVGYCDQRGADDYNVVLGQKRAHAVKAFLEGLGISPQRLTEVSLGKTSPVLNTEGQTDARSNRRVEFKIQPAA
ncbi:OmpA family protein [uncultured Desulfobacter sp.]|uniref:OmpA family protein n=1 Tax=uncultured Desulfobacter sp. TaxID=240139 RepID=UPI002AAB87C3|nr:OmpA family protein [uncultured Desulfobacter sp.]